MRLYNWKKFNENVEDIHSICEEYGIIDYTINEDGSIDVNYNVYLTQKGLTRLPLNFRNVDGDFYCFRNELTTLEGSPINVSGCFACSSNKLTTLVGGPKRVGDFYCNNNLLTTLKGGPDEVGDFYECGNNKLINVEGFPEFWEGNLEIDNNPVYEIIRLFPSEKWCKAIYLINEYGAIDGNRVNSYVLEEIFRELGLTPPEIKYIKGYEII